MKHEAAPCSSSSSTTDNLETTGTSSHSSPFIPSRILFIKNNTWVDLPSQLFQKLRDRFSFSKPIQEIEFEGRNYAFDFNKLVQIDSHTGTENPIAWIGIHGQCIFPIPPTNSNEKSTMAKFPGAEELREDNKLYKIVAKLFINGMKRDGAYSEVMKVYKCMFSSERFKSFRATIEMVKEVRGDTNVCYGWFGGSSEDVVAAVNHGFGRCKDGHLSSPHFPYQSSLLCEEDENGERHIVLCQVIIGNSTDMVRNMHMNTQILPEHIVTFKARKHVKFLRTQPAVVAAQCFKKLLIEMGGYLPSAELRSLELIYIEYKRGKMSKDAFIRILRAVAGDKLLASSIRRNRGC